MALEREVARLEQRIDWIETVMIRLLSGVTGGLLLAGMLTTLWAEDTDDGFSRVRLVTVGFLSLSEGTEDGGIWIAIGIGFLGLVVAAAVAVLVCGHQWARAGTETTARVGRIAAGLLLGGVWVPIVLCLGFDEPDAEIGPGIWLFTAGVLLFALSSFTRGVQSLWVRRTERARAPQETVRS